MGMCWKNESRKTAHLIIPLTSKIKLEFGLVLKGNSLKSLSILITCLQGDLLELQGEVTC